jgi:proline dehydrogenase
MNTMANSQSFLLNPDKNIVLHQLVRRLVFDHFTAGETELEVRKTIAQMKGLGFRGVILGYAKEVNVTGGETRFETHRIPGLDIDAASVKEWKDGTLKTLSLLGKGDFLAIK